jgi:hypothetical protein
VPTLLVEIFLYGRAKRRVRQGMERALIAYRRELFGECVSGEQSDERFGVVRTDAAQLHMRGFDRARGNFTPERHCDRFRPPSA